MRILLLEPQTLLCESLETLIKAKRASVQLETFQERSLLQRALETPAEKLILSTSMRDNLFEFVSRQRQKHPSMMIYMLVESIHLPWAHLLLKAGATAILPKTLSITKFMECLFAPSSKPLLPPEIAQQLKEKEQSWKESPFSALSQRETDILLLLFKGLSVIQIGKQLHLSPKTISTYKARVTEKLNVTSIINAFCLAIDYGLLEPQNLRQLQQVM